MNVLKNRFLKRAIAFSMTAVMTVSVSVMAFAEDGTMDKTDKKRTAESQL